MRYLVRLALAAVGLPLFLLAMLAWQGDFPEG